MKKLPIPVSKTSLSEGEVHSSTLKSMGQFPISLTSHSGALLLILITVLVFVPTFFNDFQRGWDDTWQLLENPFVLDPSWENIKYHFANFYHGQYSPINTLVYIATHKGFGFNPMAFHTACLLFHLLNAFLTFYIIRDIVRVLKPDFSANRVVFYSFFTALIFALHPLQVESVAWISASKVVLYATFALAALWFYIKYIKTAQWWWLILVFLAYTLGFGSKEQAIILPLNLLAIDYVYGRFKGIKSVKSFLYKKTILEKIPFFALALLFWYFSAVHNLGNLRVEDAFPFHQRLLMGAQSLTEYIYRSIAPVKLYYFYFFPINVGESLPLYYWVYPLLIAIIGGFVWGHYKKGNILVLFGFLFFLINILLVLHIIPSPREMITADRYMYLSIIGLALIGAWYIDYAYGNYRKYRKGLVLSILLYVLFLGVHTFIRTQDWKNSKQMKSNVIELIERKKAADETVDKINTIPKENE